MNLLLNPIISITKARGKLGDLTKKTKGKNFIILTKGGKPEAALVDIQYLAKLQRDLAKTYQKTFIDVSLLPYTREFSNKEISGWEKEDQLQK